MSATDERDEAWRRDLEIYSVLRAYSRDESELVNQRLNWLGVSQSILLTGYAALITTVANNDAARVAANLSVDGFGVHIAGAWMLYGMFTSIALTGALLCIVTFLNVGWAYRTSDTISTKWREYLTTLADDRLRKHLPFMEFGFDNLGARAAPTWRLGVVLIPAVFCTVWLILGGFASLLVYTALHR